MSQSKMPDDLKALLLMIGIPLVCVLILWGPVLLWKLLHG